MDAVIVSDVHCDGPSSRTQYDFLAFLRRLRGPRLVLLGDIFHAFWAPRGTPFPAYRPVLDALADFDVVALPGNHDFTLPAWLALHGAQVAHPDPGAIGAKIEVALGARHAHLSHGDEVDQSFGYRSLHFGLRGAAFARSMDAAGEQVAWSTLHKLAGPLGGGEPNPALVSAQRRRAEALESSGFDLVAMGHTHDPACDPLPGGGIFLNTGDWVTHRTYGVVDGDRVELRRFE